MSLILDWNLGLGDHIICNGLVRVLAERHPQVVLPVWLHNHPSVEAMFADLQNVKLLPVRSESSLPGALSIGIHNPDFGQGPGTFDQEFYRLAGVDFHHRWSSFKIPEGTPQFDSPERPYILIHGQSSEGYQIDDARIDSDLERVYVEKRREIPITGWLRMIERAREIHCIDSAFVHLADSVPSTGGLFFHAYARGKGFQRQKNWEVLD